MAKKIYLSYTGFTKLVECPQSYYLEYRMKERPDIQDHRNVLNGNVLHNLLEAYINNGVNDTRWLLDNLNTFWNDYVDNHFIDFKFPVEEDKKALLEKATKWTESLAKLLTDSKIDVGSCIPELKADTDVKVGKYTVRMGARLDVVLRNDSYEYMFLDLKASENRAIMKFDQLVWYSYVLGEYVGDQSKIKACGYILPGFNEIKMYQVPQDAKNKLINRLEEALQVLEKEIWTPKPEARRCFFCPVKHACPEFGAGVPRESGIVELG